MAEMESVWGDAITVAKQEIEYSFVLQCPRIVDTVSEKNLC